MKPFIVAAACWLTLLVSFPAISQDASKRKSKQKVIKARPNILWLFAEDTSPWMGCYGDPINQGATPHIDSLADRGIRFSRAFVPAPVCSACRSALMGGRNQIRFNAHEHRSSRGPAKLYLPKGMKLLPQIVKESGYFTFNLGKSDYNFIWDEEATYSLQQKGRSPVPWEQLKSNQPFFGQIQTTGERTTRPSFRRIGKSILRRLLFHPTIHRTTCIVKSSPNTMTRFAKTMTSLVKCSQVCKQLDSRTTRLWFTSVTMARTTWFVTNKCLPREVCTSPS